MRAAPRVGSHRFLKLHAHGAPEKNAEPLLQQELDQVLAQVRIACEYRGWQLIFATAWEAAQAIQAIAAGQDPLSKLAASPLAESRKA